MVSALKGHLVIIGGAEDRVGKKTVLQRVVELSGGADAHMVVLTTASSLGPEIEKVYEKAFKDLGVAKVTTLHIHNREDANDPELVKIMYDATGIFMTGGDQTRLASILGGSEVGKAMHRAFKKKGACVAGTSAGASAISDHMIAGGRAGVHPKKGMLSLVPGLGLLGRVILDQHFSQRHRLGRLLSIVAQNPFMLGVGIDEDTAIVVEPDTCFEVIGKGSVTVVDARSMNYCNVNEAKKGELLAMSNLQLHLLPAGYRYHIETRVPGKPHVSPVEAIDATEIKKVIKKKPLAKKKPAAPKAPKAPAPLAAVPTPLAKVTPSTKQPAKAKITSP